ncbi:MAG TPA: Type 1 glutamine amidotransferase-like domain-containing protein [Steroidobacteraceae bacterium]|jgi:peptidase E|nr:Type 1 glutamine amidotransferase-like domain-containing protein [Steroidobacteraceae bacterium]
MADVIFLGPQFREPNLALALRQQAITGPLVSISAGWQEREGEIDELRAHVAVPVTDLGLYARAEEVFARDVELHSAYRSRQSRLREMQDLYRLRLAHAVAATRELLDREGDPKLVRRAARSALHVLRALDREHLANIEREHAAFRRLWRVQQRASVVPHIEALRALIEPAAAVLIAGGHVAVLANRLRLFDLQRLLVGKTLIAWSAGAMALSERIVLFHDHPPQGPGIAEVFDAGLGLARGVVPLPSAQSRLALHDHERVAQFVRRFAPARCLTLDEGSFVHWRSGQLTGASASWRLSRSGALAEVRTA